ncbi:MAG: hypothetical protein R2747_02090 [Pyrinomonadaceae bacterium]
MKKNTFSFLIGWAAFFVGISVASILYLNPFPEISQNEIPPVNSEFPKTLVEDSSEIYSAVLKIERFRPDLLIISDQSVEETSGFTEKLDQRVAFLKKETVRDFIDQNKTSDDLTRFFPNKKEVHLLSRKEAILIFKKSPQGWGEFLKIYPKAGGIISFSRIGFNPDRTQALVYVAKRCGPLCGDGAMIFLLKKDGEWVVKKDLGIWVS